ncbi:ankyrin repeat domain-containing protein [Phycicoccus sp. BSK3Z-2]|uniref:Ankyrin repeat domain-containing protein n=1 Tax=Phycicoccus avicenniae TaxID=2828860 RepID=A0A941D5D3_9MICO|nr:ankyrin repeat domain-containing protein [Phycicoccus avicenniae]MBR7741868.1 ankyrin repeat domain-containing protein [Phycicoccus avicenniae]
MNLVRAVTEECSTVVVARIGEHDDVDERDSRGLTALLVAAGRGRVDIVQALVTAGADVHAVDPAMGATALHKAAQSGSTEAIDLLVAAGAFLDQQSPVLGHTPLMDAVSYGHDDAVAVLLGHGARTSPRNGFGQTALEIAQADRSTDIATLVEARILDDAARVVGHRLAAAAKTGDVQEAERQLAAGAVVDERMPTTGTPDDDYTPLGLAAREGHVAMVRLLVRAGADGRARNGLMGGTALHEAAYWGHPAVIHELTNGTADVEIEARGAYNGYTALHDAVWRGHRDAVRALVAAGADPGAEGHSGMTPSALSATHGYSDIATWLAGEGSVR